MSDHADHLNDLALTVDILDILKEQALRGTTITYGAIVGRLEDLGWTGLTPRHSLNLPLDYLQCYCIGAGVPPISAIVLRQDGTIGRGFHKWVVDDEAARAEVFQYDWGNPSLPRFPRHRRGGR